MYDKWFGLILCLSIGILALIPALFFLISFFYEKTSPTGRLINIVIIFIFGSISYICLKQAYRQYKRDMHKEIHG